jgi:hypothetical protein
MRLWIRIKLIRIHNTFGTGARFFIDCNCYCDYDACVGSWCPPIYFNHLCYSASFLRKPRLEALPKYIGPGPVGLLYVSQ